MSRGDEVGVPRLREPEQIAELHAPVALHARIGCAPVDVGVHVRLYDAGFEVVGEVDHVMRDVELRGDASGVLDVGGAATSRVGLAAPQLQRHTGHVVPGVA